MDSKKHPKNQPPLMADEDFDFQLAGKMADSDDENEDDDAQPAFRYDADEVMCPKCESENVNFHGQARAAYMPRLRPYTCNDCGHEFGEGDWHDVF